MRRAYHGEHSPHSRVWVGVKRTCVVIPWPQGLHLRPATQLLQAARSFRSSIHLRCGDRIADARNILAVLTLCATMGTGLIVEISGDDEQAASQLIEQVFAAATDSPAVGSS
jgi:phosphotransferase system HPr (HPr) family protein